jgi:hypothetical protein
MHAKTITKAPKHPLFLIFTACTIHHSIRLVAVPAPAPAPPGLAIPGAAAAREIRLLPLMADWESRAQSECSLRPRPCSRRLAPGPVQARRQASLAQVTSGTGLSRLTMHKFHSGDSIYLDRIITISTFQGIPVLHCNCFARAAESTHFSVQSGGRAKQQRRSRRRRRVVPPRTLGMCGTVQCI